jgi:hypothetical protein
METDRFSSREEVEWNQGAFDDGAKARIVYDAPLSSAPSPEVIGEWCHKSWRAGWTDADASLAAQSGDQSCHGRQAKGEAK